MATPILKLACVLLLFVFTGFGDFANGSGSEAYVTLLYGDEFLLGVRVLGKSIRDTGSSKEMLVLVSDGVSGHAKAQLKVPFLLQIQSGDYFWDGIFFQHYSFCHSKLI